MTLSDKEKKEAVEAIIRKLAVYRIEKKTQA